MCGEKLVVADAPGQGDVHPSHHTLKKARYAANQESGKGHNDMGDNDGCIPAVNRAFVDS
ncbi:hypothetical protein D3C73_1500650 [compost metagenome]